MADAGTTPLREALKHVAVALKDIGVPFALTGGYAVWARGGPEPVHDADFVIAESDAELVRRALSERGLDVRQPPEDWLFKVHFDDVFVDVLHRMSSDPTTREDVEESDQVEVLSIEMPVLSATSVFVHKLNALDEHHCDLSRVIPVARALREQIDWAEVRRRRSGDWSLRRHLEPGEQEQNGGGVAYGGCHDRRRSHRQPSLDRAARHRGDGRRGSAAA